MYIFAGAATATILLLIYALLPKATIKESNFNHKGAIHKGASTDAAIWSKTNFGHIGNHHSLSSSLPFPALLSFYP
jgi:hypothetical protein